MTDLDDQALRFMQERHLATLSLVAVDPPVHVTPVGFTWDNLHHVARVITFADAKKVRLVQDAGSLAGALSQVDGGRWLTLYGEVFVSDDPAVNADAERRYAARYRPPGDRGADRRTLELRVDRIIGRC